MADSRAGRRGSYAKGIAKREEILTRALEVIAREGYRGASVKELAAAVGLSQAGLLHYFDSKEELFLEILRKRDDLDSAAYPVHGPDADLRGGFTEVMRHNAQVPGLVQLFARLSVDAAEPAHPAHGYFIERGRGVRETLRMAAAAQQARGELTDRIDPETLARVLQALGDGLQVQLLVEPDLDMGAIADALLDALSTPPDGQGRPDGGG